MHLMQALNKDFAVGVLTIPCKNVAIGWRAEQTDVIQTSYKLGSGGFALAAGQFFGTFWQKLAILTPFGTHFERF